MNKTILTSPLVILLAALLAACAPETHQDEPIQDRDSLINDGFKPPQKTPLVPGPGKTEVGAHSLPWPVEFQDAAHTIGNVMVQYQPFGQGYIHAGCDLRTRAGAPVRAPVGGKLEAGHYSYAVNDDGSMDKYWKPWPQAGRDLYFEVAVVTDDGTRYEFHHVNRGTLPKNVVDILNRGGRVAPGETIGYTIAWPDGVYHHIHYNVIKVDGVRVNPEYISEVIPDTLAPDVQGVYAVMPSGQVVNFDSGQFNTRPKEFIVAVIDKKDHNVYEHPPTWARLSFASGAVAGWDFRQYLLAPNGRFPRMWELFAKSIRTPEGKTLSTTGGYGTGRSLIRLKVPQNASGAFQIEVGDILDNVQTLNGTIL